MTTIGAKFVAFVWLTAITASNLLAADHRSLLDVRSSAQQVPLHAWQSIGPTPPAIGAAITAHTPSHTIYIAGEGGSVLKSTDGGTTFVALNDGPQGVASMVMDPNDPNVVYAGVAKTTDGGATWIDLGGHGAVFGIVMDPTNSN